MRRGRGPAARQDLPQVAQQYKRQLIEAISCTHGQDYNGCFVGHAASSLPVGYPTAIRADAKGLFTEMQILPTTQGDDLLATAKALGADQQAFRHVDRFPDSRC